MLQGLATSARADDPAPRVGRQAAAKYFQKRQTASNDVDDQGSGPSAYSSGSGNSSSSSSFQGSGDHYLALHFGKMMSSQAYDWGPQPMMKDAGDYTAGITYRLGEWKNSMDLNLRLDFIQYTLDGATQTHPQKLSFLPMITLPDVSSRFPLYFGVGMGPGVFLQQVDGKAPLSLDYQLIAGARFFNVVDNAGFFIEAGLKNHLLLWNSGQFNGTFLAAGAVFTF